MKRLLMTWLAACLIGITTVSAYSLSSVRADARFLTDRMAYEMGLTVQQYDDIYEVNFDFINNVRRLMPAVARGDEWALDDYYRLLDVRNDDLRWILSMSQYGRFINIDYFFRPIYTSGRNWYFRVYTRYPDRRVFYFNNSYCPAHYRRYGGEHYRTRYNNVSYYRTHFNDHYQHQVYDRSHAIRTSRPERNDFYRQRDFGVTRPNNNVRPNNNIRPNQVNRNNNNGIRLDNVNRSNNDRRQNVNGRNDVNRNDVNKVRPNNNRQNDNLNRPVSNDNRNDRSGWNVNRQNSERKESRVNESRRSENSRSNASVRSNNGSSRRSEGNSRSGKSDNNDNRRSRR